MSGRFITMMFGLMGAAFAIYRCAKPENKKIVGGLMLTAALTSFMTGITEPLEFSFLFVAPVLYVAHAILDGLAFMLAHIFSITIGQTFSGGFIDYILFGVLQGQAKTNFLYVLLIGIPWSLVYYAVFTFLIKKFNLKTPGREGKLTEEPGIKGLKASARATRIVMALGGRNNLETVDCCATRLRVTVKDASKVRDTDFAATGSKGIIHKGNGVQVVYGPQVTVIKNEIEELLLTAPKDDWPTEKGTQIKAPGSGCILPLEKVPDEVFSKGIMGPGVAIDLKGNTVVAPCDGTVVLVAETKHAIALSTEDNEEILIHVGLDTVALGGEGFSPMVKKGDQVKAGDCLMTIDRDFLVEKGVCLITPVILCNAEEHPLTLTGATGEAEAGKTELFTL